MTFLHEEFRSQTIQKTTRNMIVDCLSKALKKVGVIMRVGSDRDGEWHVNDGKGR